MKSFVIKVYKAEVKFIKRIVNRIGEFTKNLFKHGPKAAVVFAAAEASTASTVGELLKGDNFKVVSLDEV